MPESNILTCQDVGIRQFFVRWWWICCTTSCRVVVSSSVGGVRSRCPCSGVWHLVSGGVVSAACVKACDGSMCPTSQMCPTPDMPDKKAEFVRQKSGMSGKTARCVRQIQVAFFVRHIWICRTHLARLPDMSDFCRTNFAFFCRTYLATGVGHIWLIGHIEPSQGRRCTFWIKFLTPSLRY